MRHITYNLQDYGRPRGRDMRLRLERVRQTLRACAGDVFSVQDIHDPDPAQRVRIFVELADTLGLQCMATRGGQGEPVPVFDPGRDTRGVGVMWRPGRVMPVDRSVRIYDRAGLGVGMAMVRLRIGEGVEVTVGSFQRRPRTPNQGADEALFAATEVYGAGPHGILGAAWNSCFASRTAEEKFYDKDPYAEVAWNPRYAAMATHDRVTGRGVARRETLEEAQNAGLVDPAAFTDAKWFRTVGHWSDEAVDLRVDGPMVTKTLGYATTSINALDEAPATEASKHLPVMFEFDAAELRAT